MSYYQNVGAATKWLSMDIQSSGTVMISPFFIFITPLDHKAEKYETNNLPEW